MAADIYDAIQAALRSGGPAPEGVTFDPRAPQGVTISDPAQRDIYAAREGRLGAGIAQQKSLDASAANQLKMLAPLLQQVGGLDPQLQSFLLGKLGMTGAPKVTDPKATQLQNQLFMAQYKNELGQGQREAQNQMMQQRLEFAKQQLEALTQQRQTQNELAAQAETRRGATPPRTQVRPLKEANILITGMADMGASPEQMQQAAEAMGYTIAGTKSSWFGGTGTPVLGMQPTVRPRASTQTGAAPSSTGAAAGEVVVEKGGKRFAISPDKVPDAIKRGYKLTK